MGTLYTNNKYNETASKYNIKLFHLFSGRTRDKHLLDLWQCPNNDQTVH